MFWFYSLFLNYYNQLLINMKLTHEEIEEFLELLNDPDIIDQTTTFIFTGIDADSSGLIDEKEFVKGLKKLFLELGGDEPTKEQIKRAINKMDTNKDHKISRIELKALVSNFRDSLKNIVENLTK